RFDVDEMAACTNSPTIGQRVGGSVVASVRSFLLVPEGGKERMPLTLRFRAPAGAEVLTGLPEAGGIQRLDSGEFPYIGFMAMGRLEVLRMPVKGRAGAGELTVAVLDEKRMLGGDELGRWIGASA